MNKRFNESECGRIVRRLTTKLREGHLLNAIYETTLLQQAMLKEFGKIRHGEQKDVSWLAAAIEKEGNGQ